MSGGGSGDSGGCLWIFVKVRTNLCLFLPIFCIGIG